MTRLLLAASLVAVFLPCRGAGAASDAGLVVGSASPPPAAATTVAAMPSAAMRPAAAPDATRLAAIRSQPMSEPTSGPAANGDLDELLPRVGADVRAALRAPTRARFWGEVAGGLAFVGVVSAADNSLRDHVLASDTAGKQSLARTIRPLGQEGGIALMAAAWGIGHAAYSPRLELVGQDGLEATLLAAGILAPALKLASGRARPNQGAGNHSFHPFSGDASFPSGESTEAFAIAAVVATHAESGWVKGVAYTLATGVAWERMEKDAHWASDVTAGALLGAGVGHWIARRHEGPLGERHHALLIPRVQPGRRDLLVGWSW